MGTMNQGLWLGSQSRAGARSHIGAAVGVLWEATLQPNARLCKGVCTQLSAANSASSNPASRLAAMLKGGRSLGASYCAINSA